MIMFLDTENGKIVSAMQVAGFFSRLMLEINN